MTVPVETWQRRAAMDAKNVRRAIATEPFPKTLYWLANQQKQVGYVYRVARRTYAEKYLNPKE